jgi:hypothetical protein
MLLGFGRGICYIFSVVTILAGLAYLFSAQYVFHQMFAFMMMVGGVFSIFLIRIIGSLDSIQHDLRYLANKEKKLAEPVDEGKGEQESK